MVDNLEHKFRSEPSLNLCVYRYCSVKEEVLVNLWIERSLTCIVNFSGWHDLLDVRYI